VKKLIHEHESPTQAEFTTQNQNHTPRYVREMYLNVAGEQGCQLVYFHTKNPTLGIVWRALEWKILVYILPI
jgi:hypothetical protein